MLMSIRLSTVRVLLFSALYLFFISLAQGQTGQQAASKNAQSPQAASTPAAAVPSSGDSNYVGSETCKTCHEDLYNAWEKTPHWKTTLDTKGGPSHQGCEGCHGPGADHVNGGGDKSKIYVFEKASAKEVDKRCLSCHAGAHPNFERSPHAKAKVGCADCHSVHHFKSEENLLKVSQSELCYSCHTEMKSAFAQPFHHKVDEGLMTCSDCHDPHGTFQGKQLKTTADQNAICTKCHTETAGPFVFEHPVVKAEGCVSCHSPHGSPNARLLNVGNVNTLCLQCHSATNLPAFPNAVSEQGGPVHNQAAQYTPCTNCHSQIHGSNATYNFFR
jgi:DmsE family decaheme c-type cytochrome